MHAVSLVVHLTALSVTCNERYLVSLFRRSQQQLFLSFFLAAGEASRGLPVTPCSAFGPARIPGPPPHPPRLRPFAQPFAPLPSHASPFAFARAPPLSATRSVLLCPDAIVFPCLSSLLTTVREFSTFRPISFAPPVASPLPNLVLCSVHVSPNSSDLGSSSHLPISPSRASLRFRSV